MALLPETILKLVKLDFEFIHFVKFLSYGNEFISVAFFRAQIESQSIKASVTLIQRSPFDPTFVVYDLNGTHPNLGSLRIHTLPFIPNYFVYNETKCFGIKEVFNPTRKGIGEDAPFPSLYS